MARSRGLGDVYKRQLLTSQPQTILVIVANHLAG
jgi:hypothetical protein